MLISAANRGDTKKVTKLIKAGSFLNTQLQDGVTALFIAAEHGHSKIVEKLIKAGASLNIQGKDGLTALHIAVQNGNSNVVEKLLKGGASLNIKMQDGATALDIATKKGYKEIAQKLIEAGASYEDNFTSLYKAATGLVYYIKEKFDDLKKIFMHGIFYYQQIIDEPSINTLPICLKDQPDYIGKSEDVSALQ